MNLILSPKQMRALEERAFSLGVSSLLLMEEAARGAFQCLSGKLGGVGGKSLLFLIGPGNNGGDGLAMARIARLSGARVHALLAEEPRGPDAITNLSYARALGVAVSSWQPEEPAPEQPDAVVDAVFGTGFHGGLPEAVLHLTERVNAWKVPVLAIDCPSGLDSATGKVENSAFIATWTVALGHLKTGLCLSPRQEHIGELLTVPLPVPEEAYQIFKESGENPLSALEASDLPARLPRRPWHIHKGQAGRVLLYAGSPGMAGAAAMAAKAALRAGAGLVYIACEREIIPVLQTLVPNAICLDLETAVKNLPDYDAFAAGCGLGQSERAWRNLSLLYKADVPSVLDADALNLLARQPLALGRKTVLTPHPGEAARMLGNVVESVSSDPLAAAGSLQARYGGTVVLKGAVSVIHNGEETALNIVGSPALAKGGSGDALTGILAAILAASPSASVFESARTACLWLGAAGQIAEKRFGERGALTGDVIDCLPEALGEVSS
ncbi:MAG: NAD(P)H-hydrate dehydratase [Eubacteriales bacterium]|nr:NAD(P)H-hydrate dehydratase [Eubacteriales bacterium]